MRRIIFACLCCLGFAVHAELVHRDNSGFVSQHHLEFSASPQQIWRALTRDISQWWNPAHTHSGDAGNLRMDTKVGGCLCEKLPEGDFEHLRVIMVDSGRELRLRGGLGPLRNNGAAGTMSFLLKEFLDKTTLDYRYAVSGTGDPELAQAVDQVQLEQLQRLKRFVGGP